MAPKFPDLTSDLPEIDWKDLFARQRETPLEPERLLEAHRKNLEAWASAQRILTQGFQTITKRQAEIMRDNMSEASGLLRTMVAERSFDPTKQAEQLKSALEAQRSYMREVAELMTKIQTDAYGIIRDRFVEGVGELRKGEAKAKTEKAQAAPETTKPEAQKKPAPAAKPAAKGKKKPSVKKK